MLRVIVPAPALFVQVITQMTSRMVSGMITDGRIFQLTTVVEPDAEKILAADPCGLWLDEAEIPAFVAN